MGLRRGEYPSIIHRIIFYFYYRSYGWFLEKKMLPITKITNLQSERVMRWDK